MCAGTIWKKPQTTAHLPHLNRVLASPGHIDRALCVCVWVCVCLAYTSEDFHMKTLRHTEDSSPSEDPKTGPRKTLAKNAENVTFYHLRGVRAPRTSMDFQPYLIYEDIRVLGSISKASRCVCVCVCVCDPVVVNHVNSAVADRLIAHWLFL